MKILIYGSGGVGGYLGAKLSKAGQEVIFLARGKHLDALRTHGMTLKSPEGDIHIDATFKDSPEGESGVDLIIMCVKSFDTEVAARRCRTVVGNETVVLSIQNGVENEGILGNILGIPHVIGGVAYIFSTIEAPGIIRHHGGTTKFRIGELHAPPGQRLRMIQEVFQSAGIDCEAVPDLLRILWDKFIFITGLAGMTAYTRKPIGALLSDSSLHDMLTCTAHETAQVARAVGIDPFRGVEERVEMNYRRMSPESTSSMYYDITNGKRIEVEALNGAVVRIGGRHSVPTPMNERIYLALKNYGHDVGPAPSS